MGRLELPASCSQSKRATNCATPGYSVFLHDTTQRKKKQDFRVCGRGCGHAQFCGSFSTDRFPPQATVSRTSGISLSEEWMSHLSSQTCVGTFKRHSAALFDPFRRSGNSSLTLFRPACFKETFRLLGFVWDWILCIKRCSVRGEQKRQAESPQRGRRKCAA